MTSNRINIKYLKTNFIGSLLLLLSVVGVYQSIRFGIASLDYYSVKNTLDTWREDLTGSNNTEYLKVTDSIRSAQALHPTNPLYRDLQGQILEWGALANYIEYEAALKKAKNYYLNAIKLRPTWPVSYASLALIKWRLGEFDSEMMSYINNSLKFGPMKAEVHILVVELGLSLYASNHLYYKELRPFVRERMSYGLRNYQSRHRIKSSIESLGQQKTSCRWMKNFDPFVYKQILECED
jgi:hypothetical protein